jgi:hypothetical protein
MKFKEQYLVILLQKFKEGRTKPLTFGRLPEMIESLLMQLMTFIILFLSRSVQDINYLNGNLGKTAVGNFSLDMILNSLGQYVTPFIFNIK